MCGYSPEAEGQTCSDCASRQRQAGASVVAAGTVVVEPRPAAAGDAVADAESGEGNAVVAAAADVAAAAVVDFVVIAASVVGKLFFAGASEKKWPKVSSGWIEVG